MKGLMSAMRILRLRQFLTAFLVGITLFLSQAVVDINPAQAAEALTPEARSFQVDDQEDYAGKGAFEAVKETIEDTADTVREKLNLDEPLPPSTKKFINQVQGKTDEVGNTFQEGLNDAAKNVESGRSSK